MESLLFDTAAIGLRVLTDHWTLCRDGDLHCLEIYRRHYSVRHYREERQPLFMGPGRKIVLLSTDGKALFGWRHFIDDTQPKQTGWNCAVFRNESSVLSSQLIAEAVRVVYARWGVNRCYTLVNPDKIRSSNPGCCFKKAGWRKTAISKTGKIILALEPT